MLPVLIFRHSPTEGPGYFAIFLEQQGIPWRLVAIDEGDALPDSLDGIGGLCFMGGPMSVNDPLPWIAPVCALIRAADAAGVPVIGHCLGGQLISKALGGTVGANPEKEIGWGDALAEDSPTARRWLGAQAGQKHTVFQWHGETFSLPPGAERLLTNRHCANQMFACGPHLGMQCHVEMTPEMVRTWSAAWGEEGVSADLPAVQTADEMCDDIPARLPAMRVLADQLYSTWILGLKAA